MVVEIPRKFNEAAQRRCLNSLRKHGSHQAAAAAAGVSCATVMSYRNDDEDFRERYNMAHEEFCGKLERKVLGETVMDGVLEPVIGRVGKDEDGIITHVVKKSDKMRELFLKKNIPGFRDQSKLDVDVSSKHGVLIIPGDPNMSIEDIERDAATAKRPAH